MSDVKLHITTKELKSWERVLKILRKMEKK
jgi:hypothetical protein